MSIPHFPIYTTCAAYLVPDDLLTVTLLNNDMDYRARFYGIHCALLKISPYPQEAKRFLKWTDIYGKLRVHYMSRA